MTIQTKVAIISIFGRGHWLATELAKAQVPVLLVDISDKMGNWEPEDAEGPFGYFEIEKSFRERLLADELSHQPASGLTLWLEEGAQLQAKLACASVAFGDKFGCDLVGGGAKRRPSSKSF